MVFLLLILRLLGAVILIGIYNLIYGTNHRDSQIVFFIISIWCFIISLGFFIAFDYTYLTYQFMCITNLGVNWIPHSLHSFSFGLDGISLFFVLLTTLLIPLCILTSWKKKFKLISDYCFYFILLEIFLILSLFSLDLVSFFISFESILIPMFFYYWYLVSLLIIQTDLTLLNKINIFVNTWLQLNCRITAAKLTCKFSEFKPGFAFLWYRFIKIFKNGKIKISVCPTKKSQKYLVWLIGEKCRNFRGISWVNLIDFFERIM